MKYLVGNRGSGITSTLLMEASRFDGIILAPTREVYRRQSIEMGIKCPRIVTFKEFLNGENNARGIDFSREKVYVDSASYLFKQLGLNNVITVADSLDFKTEK